MAEIVVKLDRIAVSLAGRPIFADLTWEIQRGQRIGLVGPNGAGKSTLMKLVAAELSADSGSAFRLAGLTWGRLEQEPALPRGLTVLQEALTALPELGDIERELDTLADRMGRPEVYGNPAALAKAMKAQERLLHQFERLDGPRYESRVKETLVALGLDKARWGTLTEHLSGGQKKLIMLAKLLVQQPLLGAQGLVQAFRIAIDLRPAHVVGQIVQFKLDGPQLRQGGQRLLQDGAAFGQGRLLLQPSPGQARQAEDAAGVGRQFLSDELHERGLARAVWPDEADALAALYLPRQVGEDRPPGQGDADTVQFDDDFGHRVASLKTKKPGNRPGSEKTRSLTLHNNQSPGAVREGNPVMEASRCVCTISFV